MERTGARPTFSPLALVGVSCVVAWAAAGAFLPAGLAVAVAGLYLGTQRRWVRRPDRGEWLALLILVAVMVCATGAAAVRAEL